MEYRTRQRTEILALLREKNGAHITAEELYQRLRSAGGSVGRTTVYRNLERLVQQGDVLKFSSGGAGACYQYRKSDACAQHFHLKCDACGRLFHVSCNRLAAMDEHLQRAHSFWIDPSKTVFYGRCDACRKETSPCK